MNRYKLLTIVNIPSGTIIGLDEKQVARRRGQLLETTTKGVYQAKGNLQFKAGEIISLAGIGKGQAGTFQPLEPEKSAPATRRGRKPGKNGAPLLPVVDGLESAHEQIPGHEEQALDDDPPGDLPDTEEQALDDDPPGDLPDTEEQALDDDPPGDLPDTEEQALDDEA